MKFGELKQQSYYYQKGGMLLHGDTIEWMSKLPDKSVDMILADLPYGTTACKWDAIISFDKLWEQYLRVIKENSAIVLTASQPFTSALIMSNPKLFKYEWIWEKAVGSNFSTLKYQPMKEHESVLVFSIGTHKYFPILENRKGSGSKRLDYKHRGSTTGEANGTQEFKGWEVGKYNKDLRNPSSVQFFNNRESTRGLHPTQKPVALFEYLIRTYTNENEIVLDNTSGSGTTAVAAINTKRRWICIEREEKYCKVTIDRIKVL